MTDKEFADKFMQMIPISPDDLGNMTGGIYRIYCKSNGKNYIGKTNNIRARLQQHFAMLSNNLHHSTKLQAAYNEFGRDAFETYILHPVNSCVGTLTEKRYKSIFNSVEDGFNMV